MSRKQYLAAMYLRLSRDDESARGGFDAGDVTEREKKAGTAGLLKSESNSIGNQRELIKAFIHGQQDIRLYDIYIEMKIA